MCLASNGALQRSVAQVQRLRPESVEWQPSSSHEEASNLRTDRVNVVFYT